MKLLEGLANAKRDYVEKKDANGKSLMSEEELQHLAMQDPTPNKKYVEWMCKRAVEEHTHNFRFIKRFDDLCNKGIITAPKNDIYQYKTIEAAMDVIPDVEKAKSHIDVEKEKEDKDMVEGAQVREFPKATIYKLTKKEASKHTGAGANWCIARQDDQLSQFDNYYYNQSCEVYYVVPKGALLKKLAKWAIISRPDGKREYWDQADVQRGLEVFLGIAAQLDLPYTAENLKEKPTAAYVPYKSTITPVAEPTEQVPGLLNRFNNTDVQN
jgi:hypothetical protein